MQSLCSINWTYLYTKCLLHGACFGKHSKCQCVCWDKWAAYKVCLFVSVCVFTAWQANSFCCDSNSEGLYWLVLMEAEISSRRTLVCPALAFSLILSLTQTDTHRPTYAQSDSETCLERPHQWIEIESNHIVKWLRNCFSLQSTSHSLPCPCKIHRVLTTEKGIQWQLSPSLLENSPGFGSFHIRVVCLEWFLLEGCILHLCFMSFTSSPFTGKSRTYLVISSNDLYHQCQHSLSGCAWCLVSVK